MEIRPEVVAGFKPITCKVIPVEGCEDFLPASFQAEQILQTAVVFEKGEELPLLLSDVAPGPPSPESGRLLRNFGFKEIIQGPAIKAGHRDEFVRVDVPGALLNRREYLIVIEMELSGCLCEGESSGLTSLGEPLGKIDSFDPFRFHNGPPIMIYCLICIFFWQIHKIFLWECQGAI